MQISDKERGRIFSIGGDINLEKGWVGNIPYSDSAYN